MSDTFKSLKECVAGPWEAVARIELDEKIDYNGVLELCKVIPLCPRLVRLVCRCWGICNEGGAELCKVIPRCTALNSLGILNNRFGLPANIELCRTLPQIRGLSEVFLGANSLYGEAIEELCRVLPKCERLTYLSLDENPLIGDEGVIRLCKVLPQCKTLTHINLDGSYSTSSTLSGLRCVLGILPHCPSLTTVMLQRNTIREDGVALVSALISRCPVWKAEKLTAEGVTLQRKAGRMPPCGHCQNIVSAARAHPNVAAAVTLPLANLTPLLNHAQLRPAVEGVERVMVRTALALQDEMAVLEKSIEERKREAAELAAEMAQDDFHEVNAVLFDRVAFERSTLMAEVRVLKKQQQKAGVAASAAVWRSENQDAISTVRQIASAVLEAPSILQKHRELLGVLYSQKGAKEAALAKCQDCMDSVRNVLVGHGKIDKKAHQFMRQGSDFMDVLRDSVASLDGRIAESNSVIKSVGVCAPPPLMEEFREFWQKVDATFKELELFSKDCAVGNVWNGSCAKHEVNRGKARFARLKLRFKADQDSLLEEMALAAEIFPNLSFSDAAVKEYDSCMQLCEDVSTGCLLEEEDSEDEADGESKVDTDANLCHFCLDSPKTCAFIPCGHVAACEACSAKLLTQKTCPICRSHITQSLRIYL